MARGLGPGDEGGGEPLRVLLVEDQPDHAELVKRSLGRHQVPIRICHVVDGEQALDYLHRRGAYADPASAPRPHVMLLDLRLPKVDGLQVLSEVRASPEFDCMPIVVLSTSDAEPDIVQAYRDGANSYLVKPLGFERFTELMESLGHYWFSWNQLPTAPAERRPLNRH